jgi:DNA-binding CsgD family transcriptional regulator
VKTEDTDALLEILCRLLALNLIRGKTKREQILLLAAAGMDRHEIASLVGTTSNTVSVELCNAKKRAKKPVEVQEGILEVADSGVQVPGAGS